MDLAPDFDEFIGSLTARGVEVIVVGAYALAFHGAPRFTGDLDILVRPTLDNAARLLTALEAFGFPVQELTPDTIVDRRRMLEMGVPRGRSPQRPRRYRCARARSGWINARERRATSEPRRQPQDDVQPRRIDARSHRAVVPIEQILT